MTTSTAIPIPAPDTEEATFDIINYKTGCRRNAAETKTAVRVQERPRPQESSANKRRMKAWKKLIALLLLSTTATVSFLAFAPWTVLAHPVTGYVLCIIGAIVMYTSGFLAAKATI